MRLFNLIETAYENFNNTINAYLKKTLEGFGIRYSNNQIFGALLTAINGVIQNAMFYIEDAFTEQNIYTATRKKSIYNLAKISGYKPYYGSAATGTVLVGMRLNYNSSSSTKKIYIPNYTTLRSSSTGLQYVMLLPTDEYVIDISKPLISHEFKVVEGTMNISQYTAIGVNNESFSVSLNGMFDEQYVNVRVNGEEWTQTGCLYDMTTGSKEYVINAGYDSLFEISFGNGVFGRRLEEGDTVVVRWLQHNGERGNIAYSGDARFTFSSVLANSNGVAIDGDEYLVIQMRSSISGGNEADSIADAKASIGYNSRSLVYTTTDNFKLFLRRFSFVGWNNVVCDSNTLTITCSCLRNLVPYLSNDVSEYYNLTPDEMVLSNTEKELLLTALDQSNKLFGGINVQFSDPLIRQYSAICYVKLSSDSVNRDDIKNKISLIFAQYFSGLSESTLFIPKSDLITNVINQYSDSISAFDFDFISEINESGFRNGYYISYKSQWVNGIYTNVPYQVQYTKDSTPGLDDFGNISLTNEMEVVLFHGGFAYYPDKTDKSNSITIDTLQVYFID